MRELKSNPHLWPRWNNRLDWTSWLKWQQQKGQNIQNGFQDTRHHIMKQRTVIPMRQKTKELSPTVGFPSYTTEKATSQIPKDSLNWGKGTESLGRLRWPESTEQRIREERAPQRSVKGPLEYSAESWSSHEWNYLRLGEKNNPNRITTVTGAHKAGKSAYF